MNETNSWTQKLLDILSRDTNNTNLFQIVIQCVKAVSTSAPQLETWPAQYYEAIDILESFASLVSTRWGISFLHWVMLCGIGNFFSSYATYNINVKMLPHKMSMTTFSHKCEERTQLEMVENPGN